MVQLDPFQTIICISHDSNTYDKHSMLPEPGQAYNPEYKMKKHEHLTQEQVKALKAISLKYLTAAQS